MLTSKIYTPCEYFKPTEPCKSCEDNRCALKNGTIHPSLMCGCDYCDNQYVRGDEEHCRAKEENT